jgi:hypothetical protein
MIADGTHLEKLRRFGLTTGLVLLTYVLAGIRVEPNARVSPLGFDFEIMRPDMLPIGLAVAAFAAMVRFYYFGHLLGTSPYRRRRDLVDGLIAHHDEYIRAGKLVKSGPFAKGRQIPMYWGPRKFSISPWRTDPEVMDARRRAFDNAFPRFAGARASAMVTEDTSYTDNGDDYQIYSVDVTIPRRCRVAAVLEDIDYSSPVWINAAALLMYGWTLVRSG